MLALHPRADFVFAAKFVDHCVLPPPHTELLPALADMLTLLLREGPLYLVTFVACTSSLLPSQELPNFLDILSNLFATSEVVFCAVLAASAAGQQGHTELALLAGITAYFRMSIVYQIRSPQEVALSNVSGNSCRRLFFSYG